jgi:hypothetical protein
MHREATAPGLETRRLPYVGNAIPREIPRRKYRRCR